MWKRDEGVRPTGVGGSTASPSSAPAERPPTGETGRAREIANIGKSVIIKGELVGSEDLTIEGQVEGKIELRQHVLTVGSNGKIKAQIFAKAVIVLGEVTGNISATEKVDIRDNGSVDGDLVSPRVAIAEGAQFRGSIDMQQRSGAQGRATAADTKGEQKPAATPAAASAQSASHAAQPAQR